MSSRDREIAAAGSGIHSVPQLPAGEEKVQRKCSELPPRTFARAGHLLLFSIATLFSNPSGLILSLTRVINIEVPEGNFRLHDFNESAVGRKRRRAQTGSGAGDVTGFASPKETGVVPGF